MTGSAANSRLTLIKPQSYGYSAAAYKDVTGSGSSLQIIGGTSGSNGTCLESDTGDTGVIVSAGHNCDSANSVLVDNNTSTVISFVAGSTFENISNNPYFAISGAPTTITVAPDTIVPGGGAGQYLESSSAVLPSTSVSASAIAIPITGGVFLVTGTGTAGSLNSCSYAGRVVTLEFAGVVTLTNSGTGGTLNQMSFTSGSDYTSANGTAVSLLCLGGNTPWIEISHS
jgi:hypothetical protein